MDIPSHIWARGYERSDPHEPLFGRYIRIDLTGRPNLRATFDAVAQLVVYGQQAAEVVPFSRVSWGVVIYGVEPHEVARIEAVKSEYVAMWERHPDVWPQLEPREVVFSVWFVDCGLRPFLGCVCEEAPWDLWVSGRDVRTERLYQRLLSEGQAPILMALNAVHAAELSDAWGGRPRNRCAERTVTPIPLLQQREVEAGVVAPLFRAFAAEVGESRAREIVGGVVRDLARQGGCAAAAGGNALEHLKTVVEKWTAGGALELTVLRDDSAAFDFDVTRCRFAEMYRRLGLAELGGLLSCARDAAMIEGFNPDITFARTQTIMAGATHCDFRYRISGTAPGS